MMERPFTVNILGHSVQMVFYLDFVPDIPKLKKFELFECHLLKVVSNRNLGFMLGIFQGRGGMCRAHTMPPIKPPPGSKIPGGGVLWGGSATAKGPAFDRPAGALYGGDGILRTLRKIWHTFRLCIFHFFLVRKDIFCISIFCTYLAAHISRVRIFPPVSTYFLHIFRVIPASRCFQPILGLFFFLRILGLFEPFCHFGLFLPVSSGKTAVILVFKA